MNKFNFLCVILDEHLNWKCHIENIALHISRSNGIFYKVTHFLPFRAVANRNYNDCTEPIFKLFNQLTFDDILKITHLKFYFKHCTYLLPLYFPSIKFIQRTEYCYYPTIRGLCFKSIKQEQK